MEMLNKSKLGKQLPSLQVSNSRESLMLTKVNSVFGVKMVLMSKFPSKEMTVTAGSFPKPLLLLHIQRESRLSSQVKMSTVISVLSKSDYSSEESQSTSLLMI